MPRRCTCCDHEDREGIDHAIVRADSYRDIAGRFDVSRNAVARHRAHVSATLVAVQARREAQGAETLADRVETLYGRASAILDAAEAEGRSTVALAAVRELRGIVELLGRLTGELDERQTTNVVNLISTPDWIEIRGIVLDALRPYPEARVAVAERLLALGGAS